MDLGRGGPTYRCGLFEGTGRNGRAGGGGGAPNRPVRARSVRGLSPVGGSLPGRRAAREANDVRLGAVGEGGPDAPGDPGGGSVGARAGRSDNAIHQTGPKGRRAAGRQAADSRLRAGEDGGLRGGSDGEPAPSAPLEGAEAKGDLVPRPVCRGEVVIFGVFVGAGESAAKNSSAASKSAALTYPNRPIGEATPEPCSGPRSTVFSAKPVLSAHVYQRPCL